MISDDIRERLRLSLRSVADLELRDAVIDLFETARARADAGDVDVVVLAARRLSCVYQLLVDAGMPPLSDVCAVISDRFLDVPGEWSWRRVLLLDDSVVVGTTLLRLRDRISERIGDDGTINCTAACLDADQCAKFLLDAVGFDSQRTRPSHDVERFSRQLVEALFEGGIPFFSDYPMTTPITLTNKIWEDHLANDGWYVVDVTAPLLAGTSRSAFTHVPTDATIDEILSRLPSAVARLVEGMKIRSYFAPNDDGTAVIARFVPIAMLAPSTPEDVDEALNGALAAIASSDTMAQQVIAPPSWSIWDNVAKHRMVQMYVATCLLDTGLSFTRQSADPQDWEVENLQIELYFGEHTDLIAGLRQAIVDDVRSKTDYSKGRPPQAIFNPPRPSWLLTNLLVRQVLWGNRELMAEPGVTPAQPSAGQVSRVGLIFGHAVASVFGFINGAFEFEQRRQIRELGDTAAYRSMFPPSNRRRVLSQGLTLRDLTMALLPDAIGGSSWQRSLISLGIDIGNDLGIVVPVTRFDEVRGVVYRSYRLGETAGIASTPMPQAAATGGWDRYSQAAQDGYPILSEVVDVTGVAHGGKVDEVPNANEAPSSSDPMVALLLAVRGAVPGEVVQQLDGEVLKIGDDHFVAQFSDSFGSGTQIVEVPASQLASDERARLKRGCLTTWTLFDVGVDRKDRQSRVRLRDEPDWDAEAMKRDAAALSALIETS